MSNYKLVVMTQPVEGREDEYNGWYNDTHIPEVLQVRGFKAAKRFKMKAPLGEHKAYPYLAIYEIQDDDINAVLGDMGEKAKTMTLSDSVSSDSYLVVYEEL